MTALRAGSALLLTTASLLLVLGSVVVVVVEAHPTLYPHVDTANTTFDPLANPPPILSWHIHVLYTLWPAEVDAAMDLRNKTIAHFSPYLGKDCDGRMDQGRLCMFALYDSVASVTHSPFPAGEWAMFIPDHQLHMVSSWLQQRRGEFSMLVHPNTGYAFHDHTSWPLWGGQPWVLNTGIFRGGHDTKRGEEGHVPGDAENPTCASNGDVCGDDMRGAMLPCCEGSACVLSSEDTLMLRCQAIEDEEPRTTSLRNVSRRSSGNTAPRGGLKKRVV